MKKLLPLAAACLVLAACLVPAAPALADRIDMGAYTCRDLSEEDEAGATLLLFWVDGYLSGVSGDLTLDSDALNHLVERISEDCAANPDQKVLDLARRLLFKKMV